MTLRGRYWEMTVGTVRVRYDDPPVGSRPLTLRFDITKTLGREPNKARIEVTNLSPTRRGALEDADEPTVQLDAGYQSDDAHDTIFVGDVSDLYTSRSEDGTDFVTTIEAQDGGRAYRTSTITRSFGRGVALATVITACADAMAVGRGNAQSVGAAADLDAGGSVFPDGLALEGRAWRALDMVCRSASLRWSVQSGVLQLRQRTRPAEVRAVRLAPGTGLIGSPTRSSRDARTGRVAVESKALLRPALYPGRVVVVESSTVVGSYQCSSVRYIGDSTGQDWYVDATLEDYEP